MADLVEYTNEQQLMIRNTFANGANEQEFRVLMETARLRNLNPFLRQVHFVKRYDRDRGHVWSVQVSIDGLRAIAERSGKYDGQDEPSFELDAKGKPLSCRVAVYRKDWSRPAVAVARWSEYIQTTKDGSPTRFWAQMPFVMLAKCAEALAIRKAFPEDTGGLYVPEEVQGGEEPAEVVPMLPPADAPRASSLPSEYEHLRRSLNDAWTLEKLASTATLIKGRHAAGAISEDERVALGKLFVARKKAIDTAATPDEVPAAPTSDAQMTDEEHAALIDQGAA
jgi:phage recombination protein Bet